jgi:hypothetical protein
MESSPKGNKKGEKTSVWNHVESKTLLYLCLHCISERIRLEELAIGMSQMIQALNPRPRAEVAVCRD